MLSILSTYQLSSPWGPQDATLDVGSQWGEGRRVSRDPAVPQGTELHARSLHHRLAGFVCLWVPRQRCTAVLMVPFPLCFSAHPHYPFSHVLAAFQDKARAQPAPVPWPRPTDAAVLLPWTEKDALLSACAPRCFPRLPVSPTRGFSAHPTLHQPG